MAIDEIPWLDQNTNTSGAIRYMRQTMFTPENGARNNVPWLGIVITDGISTYDPELTIPEADLAKDSNIVMFAIGMQDLCLVSSQSSRCTRQRHVIYTETVSQTQCSI